MQPNPIDVAIGRNVRAVRERQGISQTTLADALGIAYQQVQKYETAINRISASRLVELARCLNCSVRDFFEGVQPAAVQMEEDPSLSNQSKIRLSELCKSMAMELGITLNTDSIYDKSTPA